MGESASGLDMYRDVRDDLLIVQHMGADRARWARIRLVQRVPELLAEIERCYREKAALRAVVDQVAAAVRDSAADPAQAIERVRDAVLRGVGGVDANAETERMVVEQVFRAAEAWCEQMRCRSRWTKAERDLYEAVSAWTAWMRRRGSR